MVLNKVNETVLNPHSNIRGNGFAQQNFICKWERSGHPDTADEFNYIASYFIFCSFPDKIL